MATILSLNPEDLPADGDVLVYDSATQKWLPEAPATGGGGAVDSVNGQTGVVTLDATDVGAQPAGSYASALGADDNYVTDAEKVKLSNLSGTNTGDQTLPTWSTISGKPAVVAAGVDAAAARTAISAAASSHTHGLADLTATGTKDATTFLRGDNTWAVPAGGGSDPWTYAVATVDTSDSTGSAVNVTGLSVSGLANGLYEIEVRLLTTTAAFATAPIPGISWPASVTLTASWETANSAGGSRTYTATTTSPSEPNATQHPASSGVVVQVNSLAGVFRAASMSGSIAVTIRTETAATAVTVKADSFIRYRRIAD